MAEQSEIAEQLRKDYRAVFTSEEGQRVLEDLKIRCFYFTPTINVDANVMAFNEGSRSVVLHIETQLKLTPTKIKELEREQGQIES